MDQIGRIQTWHPRKMVELRSMTSVYVRQQCCISPELLYPCASKSHLRRLNITGHRQLDRGRIQHSSSMSTVDANVATWTRARASLSILTISVGISLFTAAYEKAVNPLFGGIATVKYMHYVMHGSTALGIILPKLPRSFLLPALATLVLVASHTSYWVGVFAARTGDPVLGSLVTHAIVLAPVTYLAVSLATSIDVGF